MNLIQTSSLTGFGDWCPTLPECLIFHSSLHFPFFSFKTPHPSLCPPPSAFPQTALMTFHNVPQIPHNPQPTITYNSEEKVCTSSDFHQLWQKTTLLSNVPWLSFPSPNKWGNTSVKACCGTFITNVQSFSSSYQLRKYWAQYEHLSRPAEYKAISPAVQGMKHRCQCWVQRQTASLDGWFIHMKQVEAQNCVSGYISAEIKVS